MVLWWRQFYQGAYRGLGGKALCAKEKPPLGKALALSGLYGKALGKGGQKTLSFTCKPHVKKRASRLSPGGEWSLKSLTANGLTLSFYSSNACFASGLTNTQSSSLLASGLTVSFEPPPFPRGSSKTGPVPSFNFFYRLTLRDSRPEIKLSIFPID